MASCGYPRPQSTHHRSTPDQRGHPDAVRDLGALLKRVEAGAEIIIERDSQPVAVIRAPAPPRRTISDCIALAKAHERETGKAPVLDPDFAADVAEIVRCRNARDPLAQG